MAGELKLALLVCDTPIASVRERYGAYPEIFKEWLRKSLEAMGSQATFTLDPYDVVQNQFPSQEQLQGEGGYHGIIITGSGLSLLLSHVCRTYAL